ncbi:MAG: N-6 DNA methylase [Aerococcus sp.]|nr:N-6 DNA methylase [Aerococcus sp.]
MQKLTYEDFYKLAGVSQHKQFENFLMDIVFQPERREKFYRGLIELGINWEEDIFRDYFELYGAERKTFKQDFTPHDVTELLSRLTRRAKDRNGYAYYDPTAGTGGLLIAKWAQDSLEMPLGGAYPSQYLYRADELADNVIPYLIHNMVIRGMNAVIVHGNSLSGVAKQAYLICNPEDDFLKFSDVNVIEHTPATSEELGIVRWEEEAIEYKETGNMMQAHFIERTKEPPPRRHPFTGAHNQTEGRGVHRKSHSGKDVSGGEHHYSSERYEGGRSAC